MKSLKPRLRFISILASLMASIFIGRLVYLQIYQHDFYHQKSKGQLEKIIKINPNRGHIYDRNEKPLALTKPAYSIYAHPRHILDPAPYFNLVGPELGITKKELKTKLNPKRSFVWLKRKVDEETMTRLKEADLEHLGIIQEEKRIYPHGRLAAHILGFVGVDNQGLGGIEYKFNTALTGKTGKLLFEGDPRRNRLASGKMETLERAYDGSHIVLTIDTYIQYLTEKYLAQAVAKHKAKTGYAIVMNPKTGEILAMAALPSFDPNTWRKTSSNADRRNKSLTDVFEPGSIFKIITVAAALEEEVVDTETILRVPETLTLYSKTIKEAHEREDPNETDDKTVSDILEKSLNVGTSILAEKLGPRKFHRYIESFGFGKRTGIELAGESPGLFRPLKDWSGIDHAIQSFGQGIASTPLQMAVAASAIANGGTLVRPNIIRYVTNASTQKREGRGHVSKHRVISPKTAQDVTEMMVNVVENGTGKIAKIPGYQIAAKTGTAQKAREDGRGYEEDKYVSSFLGFFPAEDPEYLILVSIDSPEKLYYGSQVAGPVFRALSLDIINQYNIPPATSSPTDF